MKKWILNLGLTTLAVLPIVAIASCSSTTNEIPTLTTEVAKYKNPFTVKEASKTMTPTEVVASINKGSNADKITALQKLVNLQLDNNNFTYVVENAVVGTNNAVDVSIKITEKADTSKTQTVKLVINGFTTPTDSALDKEVARFTVSVAANETGKALKATQVVTQITEAAESAKLGELQKITTVPEPSTGFTIKVLTAVVGSIPTTVDVTIEITQASDSKSAQAKFTVTGFSTLSPEEILTAQAARLINQEVLEGKKTETPTEAKAAMTKENLNEYYKQITLSDGITYEFVSSALNTTTNTTLDVTLTVKSNVSGIADITKKVEITGFTSPQAEIEAEAKKIVNNTVLTPKNGETAVQAAGEINASTLTSYYAQVELSTGFSYTWKSNKVIGDTVEVTVTVSSTKDGIMPIDHTFIISGFKTALEAEAEKFAISLAAKTGLNASITTRFVVSSLNQTADTQMKKLTAINALVDNFPSFSAGYALNIGVATIAGNNANTSTSVTIPLTISQPSSSTSKVVTFTITGLTAETLQAETDRLATTYLVTKPVLEGKAGETAADASTAITDLTTLESYYKFTPLPTGFQYNYISDAADGDTVKVQITVSTTSDGQTITSTSKEVIITGFKRVALVNLEEEAKKLINQEAPTGKRNETATQAKAAITNDSTLNAYYTPISGLSSNYGYKYGGKSEVNKANNTILDVTLQVINRNVTPNLSIFKVVQISNFTAATPIEQEALKFQISTPAKTPSTLTMGVISVINAIGEDQAKKLEALKAYATDVPTLSAGYTLSIGLAAPDATTPTSVNVPITISPNAPAEGSRTTPVTVIFTITGLTEGTQQQQLDAISKLFNDRTVLTAKAEETAAVAQKNLVSDSTLNTYYQNTTMPSQFSYNYGGLTEVDKETKTTLNVTLRISFRNNSGPVMFKVVKISGFTQLTTFEDEAQKFAISTPLTLEGTTTATAISNINTTATTQEQKLAALKALITNFPETTGYTIAVQTAKIDPTTATSVVVPMTITKVVTGNETAPMPVSVNVIITGFAAPTES